MRIHLMNSVFRGPVYSMDTGGGSGTKPSFMDRFRRQQQPQQTQQRTQQSNQQQFQTSVDNNTEDNVEDENVEDDDDFQTFLDNNKDLWQDDDAGNEINEEDEEKRKAKETSRLAVFKDYVSKQNFGLKVDVAKMKEAIETNNPEYINNVLNEALQRGLAKTLDDTIRMITESESRIRNVVQNITQNNISARESELSLFEAVPLAKSPALRPLALSTKARFMKKGATDEEANMAVQKMFETIRRAPADQFGLEDENLTTPLNGRRTHGKTTRQKPVQIVDGEPQDWVGFLTRG